jgi:hypothetical protein
MRGGVIGSLAAAALLAGSVAVSSAPRAQAQAFDCAAEFGTAGVACGEIRFNMSPAPDTVPPTPILAGPPPPAVVAAQPGPPDQSQAGPQEEAQPGGME